MRHDRSHHQGLRALDRSRAADLKPILAWAKTAARYPQTALYMDWLLEHSEPLVHWLASAQPLLEEWLSRWMEAPETVLEAHRVEYTRLFVVRWGGVPVPLYASWYLSRETYHGEAAEKAIGFYERAGLVWREAEFREPPDHLAVELEFLEMLCHAAVEREARRDGEIPAARALWHDFRRHHFDLWVPQCAEAMERHAGEPVYRILALCLGQLCKEE